jgi:DNA polymerase V
LMKTLDKINKKWGGDTVKYASSGVDKVWRMRQLRKSQYYTTRWNGLLKINI